MENNYMIAYFIEFLIAEWQVYQVSANYRFVRRYYLGNGITLWDIWNFL